MVNTNLLLRSMGILPGQQSSAEGDGGDDGGGSGVIGANGVAVAFGSSGTSTGTMDLTTSNLNGKTPKAAIMVLSGVPRGSGVGADQLMCIGMTDGTSEYAFATYGTSGSVGARGCYNDAVAVQMDSFANTDGKASFVSFIPDGIRIDWTEAPASDFEIHTYLFAGDDLSAHLTSLEPNAGFGGGTDISPGFEPEAVFACSIGDDMPGQSSTVTCLSFGCAIPNGGTPINKMIAQGGDYNERTSRVDDFIASQTIDNAVSWDAAVENFTATSYDIYAYDNPSNDEVALLSISYGGNASYALDNYVHPTATGLNSVSGLSFQPDQVIGALSFEDTGGMSKGYVSNGTYFIAGDGISSTWNIAADLGDAASAADQNALVLTDEVESKVIEATLDSINSDGWTLDYTLADIRRRSGWYLAIGF